MAAVQGASIASSIPLFVNFGLHLDAHHERRERITKASRDITAMSKKVIFSLHRSKIQPSRLNLPLTRDVEGKLETIRGLLGTVAADFAGGHAWRYQRQLSPGVQELVEALTFRGWIEDGRLLGVEEIRSWVRSAHSGGDGTGKPRGEEGQPGSIVTDEDYLMGVFDLTGEIMRWCITNVSTLNFQSQSGPLQDLRALRSNLEAVYAGSSSAAPLSKELSKKVQVLQASVEKVEWAAYGVAVRGNERPPGWAPDLGDLSERTGVGAGASNEVDG